MNDMVRRLLAEFLGTFILVLGGCGTAVLAGGVVGGTEGVALAFGLTVVVGAYAFGAISGGHFNPAVTIGLWLGKRVESAAVLPYIVVQLLGAIAGAGVVAVMANGVSSFDLQPETFAVNGWANLSPGGYDFTAAVVAEVVLTAVFLLIILGASSKAATPGFAGLAIGLSLTLIHLISIPVTNTSVNPARSTGPALFAGGDAIEQLWLFWLAPIVGAIIGALIYGILEPVAKADQPAPTEP